MTGGDGLDPIGRDVSERPDLHCRIDKRGRIAASRRGVVNDEFMRQKVQPLLREGA